MTQQFDRESSSRVKNNALEGEILFVCVENAGRSQMAQAFAEKSGMKASSAGTVPSSRVNPVVVEAMRERGIDLSRRTPKILTADLISNARLVITMGCSVEEACPRPMLAAMQKKLVDWHVDDPKGRSIEEVRRIRNEIEKRVREIAQEE
ncbi:arsenate reductase ArsC [Candidatus Bathyarchaeota archaeon]|nr:MAG: arsenate reductase ArsC [Candidatus Bathyarchaeota archaeon]